MLFYIIVSLFFTLCCFRLPTVNLIVYWLWNDINLYEGSNQRLVKLFINDHADFINMADTATNGNLVNDILCPAPNCNARWPATTHHLFYSNSLVFMKVRLILLPALNNVHDNRGQDWEGQTPCYLGFWNKWGVVLLRQPLGRLQNRHKTVWWRHNLPASGMLWWDSQERLITNIYVTHVVRWNDTTWANTIPSCPSRKYYGCTPRTTTDEAGPWWTGQSFLRQTERPGQRMSVQDKVHMWARKQLLWKHGSRYPHHWPGWRWHTSWSPGPVKPRNVSGRNNSLHRGKRERQAICQQNQTAVPTHINQRKQHL